MDTLFARAHSNVILAVLLEALTSMLRRVPPGEHTVAYSATCHRFAAGSPDFRTTVGGVLIGPLGVLPAAPLVVCGLIAAGRHRSGGARE